MRKCARLSRFAPATTSEKHLDYPGEQTIFECSVLPRSFSRLPSTLKKSTVPRSGTPRLSFVRSRVKTGRCGPICVARISRLRQTMAATAAAPPGLGGAELLSETQRGYIDELGSPGIVRSHQDSSSDSANDSITNGGAPLAHPRWFLIYARGRAMSGFPC